MLKTILSERKLSVRAVSQSSGIPYSTLNDLINNKKSIDNCSVGVLSKLSTQLNIEMELLYELIKAEEENGIIRFRNLLLEEFEKKGAASFVDYYMSDDRVESVYHSDRLSGLYLVCLLDLICDTHNIQREAKFDYIRKRKIKAPYYVRSKDKYLAFDNFIPQFAECNIYEKKNVYPSLTGNYLDLQSERYLKYKAQLKEKMERGEL